jgi:hypothetical protein
VPSGGIDALRQLTHWFNLNEKLLKGVLCFMLFRGSVNVRWASLHEQQWLVLSLAFADTAMRRLLTGALANTLLEQASRKREQLRHPRLRGVEAVIEAGDLRQCRMPFGQRLDCRQVVGKVAKGRTRRVSRYRQWLVHSTGSGWCTSPRRTRPGVPLPPLGHLSHGLRSSR